MHGWRPRNIILSYEKVGGTITHTSTNKAGPEPEVNGRVDLQHSCDSELYIRSRIKQPKKLISTIIQFTILILSVN